MAYLCIIVLYHKTPVNENNFSVFMYVMKLVILLIYDYLKNINTPDIFYWPKGFKINFKEQNISYKVGKICCYCRTFLYAYTCIYEKYVLIVM